MKKKILFIFLILLSVFIFSGCKTELEKQQYEIYKLAKEEGYEGTFEDWVASIKGADGKDGKEIEVSIENNKIVWRYVGDTEWKEIYSVDDLIGPKGEDGHTPEIKVGDNGNWFIDGKDTGIHAQGEPGYSPKIKIGENGNWFIDDKDTNVLAQGPQGVSINSIEKVKTEGLVDTYKVTFSNDTTFEYTITNGYTPEIKIGENGNWFIDNKDTNIHAEGPRGISIKTIEKVKTEGLLDTYRITYSNDEIFEFTLTNANSISKIEKVSSDPITLVDTYKITYTNGQVFEFNVQNGKGIKSFEKVESIGLVDKYKIIYTNGETFEFEITNANSISKIEKIKTEGVVDTYQITYTNGTTFTYEVQNGKSSYQLYLEKHPEYIKTEEEWLDDLVNGRLGTEEVVKYTVKFITGTTEVIEDQLVEENKKAKKPVNPTKEGYTFDGWYIDDEKWVFNGFPVTNDITLTAKWIINEYNVLINYNNDKPAETKVVKYNNEITLGNPVKVGYEFVRWEDNEGNEMTFPYQVKSDININAIWGIKLQLIFNTNGGNLINNMDVVSKTLVNELPIPVKDGYAFTGWFYNNGNEEVELSTPFKCEFVNNTTLTAHWRLTVGDYKVEELSDGTLKVIGYSGQDTNIIIPNEINGKQVSTIGSNAFQNNSNIISLKLGNNIKSIEDNAFKNMIGLLNIDFNDGVVTYGNNLLIESTSLEEISIANNVKLLKLFDFDENNIPATLNKIKIKFSENTSLVKDLLLSDMVNKLFDVDFIGNWKEIRANECKGLNVIKSLSFSDSVNKICSYSFSSCSNLLKIDGLNKVEYIENNAFNWCNGLISVVIPKNVKSIGYSAFKGCLSLNNVFYEGTEEELNKIIKFNSDDTWGTPFIEYNTSVNKLTDIKNENYEYLKTNTNKIIFYNCINKSIKFIDFNIEFKDSEVIAITGRHKNANVGFVGGFYGCNNLDTVILPKNLQAIGKAAFTGSAIKSIEFPKSIKMINRDAFSECTLLNNVIFNEGLEEIASCAFEYCYSLKYIVLPSTLLTIEKEAFYYCRGLKAIVMPKSLVNYENSFSGCSTLCNVFYTGTKEQWINSKMHSNYNYLERVNIEYNSKVNSIEICENDKFKFLKTNDNKAIVYYIKNIDNKILDFNQELKGLNIVGITSDYILPKDAYSSGTVKLVEKNKLLIEKIILPDSLKAIGNYTFSDLQNLKEIIIPNSITCIGYNAFDNCSSLTNIIIPKLVTCIGENAFLNCKNLIINCEINSELISWDDRWNPDNRPVNWGYKGN